MPQKAHARLVQLCEPGVSPARARSGPGGCEETPSEALTPWGFWSPAYWICVALFGSINLGVCLDLGNVLA